MSKLEFQIYFQFGIDGDSTSWSFEDGPFILGIETENGDVYELTVWTQSYLNRVWAESRESGAPLSGQYLIPPDLIIADMDVGAIEGIVADLILTKRLRPHWQVPDEYTASWFEDEDIGDMEDHNEAESERLVETVLDTDAVCRCYSQRR